LKIPNFLVEFVTPIVRVSHWYFSPSKRDPDMLAQVTKGKQRIDFFTIPEYEQWLEQTPDAHKWDSKYYKVCHLPIQPLRRLS
jgi:DNA topoisomerase II